MKKIKTCFLLLLFSFATIGIGATVSEYAFASTLGTFTEISGGTILGSNANDNESFNAIPLGFTFTYNGVAYTEVSVQTNGFLAMGSSVATSNLAISSATGTNNIVAALNRDIKSLTNGELMYLMSGTEPNRIFTVQWKHYRRTPSATALDDFTFQIQLQENGNHVLFVYGPFTTVTSTSAQSVQVGLRGDSNADFNNRSTTTDWSNTIAGTANNSFCVLSATVFPASGLTFTFSPPASGQPPLPAQNPVPPNNAINVALTADLSWVAGGGIVEGYKVFLGTDNPPTNIANGTIQTATTYDAPTFSYSTTYFWKIVPFNQFGDAVDCPVWTFTTLADPTVTSFPYYQNFDSVTPPALPPGWTTINANNDSYTWETYAGNYQSTPNSVRVRFNPTLDMNDWLLMPPMQLNQSTYYKVRFYYKATSSDFPERLALYWGNAPLTDSLSHQIFVNENITNTTYMIGEGIMQAPASGIYHFGFKGYSVMDHFYIYLDTISFDTWVEILNPPVNLTASVNEANVHLSWNAPLESRALLGYKIYRNNNLLATISTPDSTSYDDTDLPSGLYSYGVSAIYTSGESVQAGPVLADVNPILLPPSNLTANVVDRDVTLNWNNPEGNWITWSNMNLGNGVGTGTATVFDVAHRWTQEDLVPYAGRSISRIEFVPLYGSCVYTIKVWTGGNANNPGNLMLSQPVPSVVINEWNTVFLNALIPIPITGDLYYGYEIDTQGGYPAGADNGPQIEGKGNMMFWGGAWTTLSAVAPTLTYNWNIRAFAQITAPGMKSTLTPITGLRNYPILSAKLDVRHFPHQENNRNVTGYKVYRDGVLLATINDEEINTYFDAGLPNATYIYGVTSISPNGESAPATVEAVVNFQMAEVFFEETFETYPDFTGTFSPWTTIDVDLSATAGFTDATFPGMGNPSSFIVFNPAAVTPPLTSVVPHGGSKMAASFASLTPPNNDWLVTPRVHFGTDSAIKFYAKSHNDSTGLASFRIGVSTLPVIIPMGFTYVTGSSYIEAPYNWTEYVYDLSAYDGQTVYLAIRCVSSGSFALYVDDFTIHSDGGSIVGNDDAVVPPLKDALSGNYPNPFNEQTTINYSIAEKGIVTVNVYNIKGQLVRTLVNENKAAGCYKIVFDGKDNNGKNIASGIYYYRMQTGKFDATRKMILLK